MDRYLIFLLHSKMDKSVVGMGEFGDLLCFKRVSTCVLNPFFEEIPESGNKNCYGCCWIFVIA